MKSIIDYFDEVIQNIRDRFQNPFTERNRTPFAGAFLVALIIYNWKILFSLISFDEQDNRLRKIQIISEYLRQEEWHSRVINPVIYAFASIIFYYVFNNLSLGLTTFFNRWFKGTILHLTDRSKIISREDFDKANNKANNVKRSYDKAKNELLESENEKEAIDIQLTELTSKYSELLSKYDELEKQNTVPVSAINPTKEGLRIVNATYGAEEIFSDVTAKVIELITSAEGFDIDNKTLGIDPVRYSVKELKIIYENIDGFHTFEGQEGELITIENNLLKGNPTEDSKQRAIYLDNQRKISNILSGEWTLTYKTKSGKEQVEKVLIDRNGRYFSNSKHTFYLRSIILNDKKITFNKVDLKRKLHSKENLIQISPDLINGSDSKGYSLEYKRLHL